MSAVQTEWEEAELLTLALEVEQRFSVGGVYVCSSTTVQQQPKSQREPEGGRAGPGGDYLLERKIKQRVRTLHDHRELFKTVST